MASKFMTGIHHHHKRNAPAARSNDLGLIGAVLKGLVALVVMILAGVEVLIGDIAKRNTVHDF